MVRGLRWISFLSVLFIIVGATAEAFDHLDYDGPRRARRPRRIQHRHPSREVRVHPNQRYRIVVDAGHGGEDFGTYSRTTPRQHEKHLTLSTAYMLRDHLTKMGYHVLMTRTGDDFISLQERVDFARNNKATLFVSLHYNSAPSDDAHGVEVFYFKEKESSPRLVQSTRLAERALHHIVRATQAKSRGVKHGNFKVIRETTIPAILIEGGFLTNEAELQKLKNPAYLNRIAKAVALSVDQYVHTK